MFLQMCNPYTQRECGQVCRNTSYTRGSLDECVGTLYTHRTSLGKCVGTLRTLPGSPKQICKNTSHIVVNVYWKLDQHLTDADVMSRNSVSYTCGNHASYISVYVHLKSEYCMQGAPFVSSLPATYNTQFLI